MNRTGYAIAMVVVLLILAGSIYGGALMLPLLWAAKPPLVATFGFLPCSAACSS